MFNNKVRLGWGADVPYSRFTGVTTNRLGGTEAWEGDYCSSESLSVGCRNLVLWWLYKH